MSRFWPWFFLFLGVLVAVVAMERPDLMEGVLLELWSITKWALIAAICLAAGVFTIGKSLEFRHEAEERKARRLSPVDGAFPLQEYKMTRGRRAIINPNLSISGVTVVDPEHGAYEMHDPEVPWGVRAAIRLAAEQTSAIRAIYPGDEARKDPNGARSLPPRINAATIRSIAAPRTPALPVIDVPPVQEETKPRNRTLTSAWEAIRQSRGNKWIIGQSKKTGEFATFDPVAQTHLGVIGATGTGKTSSIGFLIAYYAMIEGRLIVLDGDRGTDWRRFGIRAEYHESDHTVLGDQLEQIFGEFERRRTLLLRQGYAAMWDADDLTRAENPPVYVLIEEVGSILSSLRTQNRSEAQRVEALIDQLLRRGRKYRIHLFFLDQYPELWTQQMIGNVKLRAVFQLGPGQGAKVEEYKAASLPDRGRFLLRGEEFDSFDCRPIADQLLADVPPSRWIPIVTADAEDTLPVSSGKAEEEVKRENEPALSSIERAARALGLASRDYGKREIIFAWRERNPDGTQADFRAWAEAVGFSAGRGYVSEMFNEWSERAIPVLDWMPAQR